MNKNVVMIVVDQLRYDSIGCHDPSGIISTPYLDQLAEKGVDFQHAYSGVPTCIPARASLMTGLKQEHHGRVGYQDEVPWNYPVTMAQTFQQQGYQTEAIGKMHVYPDRHRCGFDHVLLHNGYLHESRKQTKAYLSQYEQVDDYLQWLKAQVPGADLIDDGLECNSWVARPWPYEERYHPTNWVTMEGLNFLSRRDPTMPFFLKLSYTRPHSPLNPPAYYFEMYANQLGALGAVSAGDWEEKQPTHLIDAKKGYLPLRELNRMKAGYYGLITHLDHQIGRFLQGLEEAQLTEETVILFVSDHGDQLGDHYLFRKGYPYQESVHVPLMMYNPAWHQESQPLVELRDVFPMLLAAATGRTVKGIDGFDYRQNEREYLHGEHLLGEDSSQFILTKTEKFIWFPQRQQEQFFDLAVDPRECHNLIDEAAYQQRIEVLRQLLIAELAQRPEGFVAEGKLKETIATTPFLGDREGRDCDAGGNWH
ncbi:arylsulfatase [Vagococcus sp. BWB3-3]|uniref:Arylsulfatase n=1 Tax=Vagococcus allomyrinae TaxID=2794353 RepID=A0A940P9L4_9ENTE|nr:arylsulfatase [Vagococcus allomyrinae]MBP1040645.1 arylsulfatase [Vagococcus allomyrinae]